MKSRTRGAFAALLAVAVMTVFPALPAQAAKGFSGVSQPTVTGTMTVGKKLTAHRDTKTTPTASKVTYQWLRGGVAISGARGATHTLKAADKGKRISVKVCYAKSGYSTKCVTSSKGSAVKSTSSSGTAGTQGSCKIKGNISSSGEKIYHVPGQRMYSRTKISEPGERWFCSESAAKKAGWRKSKI